MVAASIRCVVSASVFLNNVVLERSYFSAEPSETEFLEMVFLQP